MANVSSNNLTTLYSGGGVNLRPTSAYGNANVVALLNAGTDGANTVTNIVATGNITANNFIGNFVGNITGTANFANYAGNVTVSSQPNITSLGTLVNVSATGNITSVSGVFVGNGAGLTNINGANVNTVANANFAAFAGNVTNSAQPNITSVGTLSNLSVSGNITTGNANLGNLAVANFFSGNGSLLTGVIASGGNSNFANFAGNVTVASQPNITSLGNLIDLRVENNNLHLGTNAGLTSQGAFSIGLGYQAGKTTQGTSAVAIGSGAGLTTQGANSVAIGTNAGQINAAAETVAIGYYAGWDQQKGAVAIGTGAGMQLQGQYGVAIGVNAGNSAQGNNSIILNATGINLNQTTPNTFTVKPVRNANTANVMFYDNTTGEITYDLSNNITVANANFANFAGNALVLANGTSNISIPTANGTIAFSVNNVANLMLLENGGVVNAFPTSSIVNMLRINTFNNSLTDAHRIAWARARGSNTSPTSVQASDRLGILSFFGHNGTSYQTNSASFIRATVDSSYTANGANIPVGMQIIVNDTNGGVNNQAKTHNFYANGFVQFANGGQFGSTTQASNVTIAGDNTTGTVLLNGVQFNVNQTNANAAAGYSPFFFRTFQSNTDPIPASKFFRSRGNISSSTAVVTGDQVALNQYAVYADSGNTFKRVFEDIITVTGNDGAGNVSANLDIVSFNTGSNINLQANTYANSVSININGFMKLAGYTAAALTAITGSVGQIATVTNSTPGGMMAYWDTTNVRWSYVHDNSAV